MEGSMDAMHTPRFVHAFIGPVLDAEQLLASIISILASSSIAVDIAVDDAMRHKAPTFHVTSQRHMDRVHEEHE